MMQQFGPSQKMRKLGVGVALVAVVAGLGVWSLPKAGFHISPSNNLFALIFNLGGTTNDMLQNTKSLHQQVQHVQSQLGQLNTESEILNQQLQTGQDLATQLKTQETLTQQGVSLMQQILGRQKTTEVLTAQVAHQANQLATTVGSSATALASLGGQLQTTLNESNTLNHQMDQLLGELSVSEDEFKFFGQVDKMLKGLLSGLPLGNTVGSTLGSLGQTLGAVGGTAGPVGSSLGSPIDSALGSLGNPVTSGTPTGLLGDVLKPHP
jgi:hypothetical protein